MTQARIYKPPKTAMQSGRANTRKWVLEFEPGEAQRPDPLMGWAGSRDTLRQVKLRFESREEAEAYAQRKRLAYEVEGEEVRHEKIRTYADNFRRR